MKKIKGIVISGKGTGKEIGFPTINLQIPNSKFQTLNSNTDFGVYFAKIYFEDKEYLGMANLGFSPTFENKTPLLEVHIFDFDRDIYGEEVAVELIKKIRETKRFDNVKELKEQLEKDKQTITNYELRITNE